MVKAINHNKLFKAALPKRLLMSNECTSNDHFPKWEQILEKLESCYDEQLLGDLRIICRFAFFHFALAGNRINDVNIGEFLHICHSDRKEQETTIWTSSYPAHVRGIEMVAFLKKEGLRQTGIAYTTTCNVNISESATKSNSVEIDVVLDEHCCVKRLYHTPMRWGSLEVIRKMIVVPGQKYMDNQADIRIQIQALRQINDWDLEPYTIVTRSKEPILQISPTHNNIHPDMPFLSVHPTFVGKVEFIRQKKIHSYKYPTSTVAKSQDHFSAHLKVDISDVREYSNTMTSKPPSVYMPVQDEYTEVTIELPTVPPLHYTEEHRELFKSILNLSLKIGDAIS